MGSDGEFFVSDHVLKLTDLVESEIIVAIPMKLTLLLFRVADVFFGILAPFEKEDLLRKSADERLIVVVDHFAETITYHLLNLCMLLGVKTILLFFPRLHGDI